MVASARYPRYHHQRSNSMAEYSTIRKAGSVQAVDRAIAILRLFSIQRAELELLEISERVGLAKSTCHRLLATLEHNGFVTSLERGHYRLGLVAAQVGEVAIRQLRPGPAAHAQLTALCEQTGETIGLTILHGDCALVIDRVESAAPLRMQYGIGTLLPVHASASGKTLLAFSAGAQELLGTRPLHAYTPATITRVDQLLAELDQIRRCGYAVDREELYLGLVCLAVPVLDRFAAPVAALGISGPSARMAPSRFPSLVMALQRHALEIAQHLDGARAPKRSAGRPRVA
jgi:DNA-binding IclR family transcriptional regulator